MLLKGIKGNIKESLSYCWWLQPPVSTSKWWLSDHHHWHRDVRAFDYAHFDSGTSTPTCQHQQPLIKLVTVCRFSNLFVSRNRNMRFLLKK